MIASVKKDRNTEMRFERVFVLAVWGGSTNDDPANKILIVKSQMCALLNHPRALPFALDYILGGNV